MSDPILILGTGLAGYTLARELRALDREAPLTLVTADDGAFYSKPMLSTALARGQSPEDLASSDAGAMAERLQARILTHTRVEAIVRGARRLESDRGPLPYGRLVLATGATPIRPPLGGDAAGEVLSVNSLEDYRRFRERLGSGPRRVALIGPGLIGCEFANDLRAAGHQVAVIGPDPWPISTLLPEAAGRDLQQALEAAGVAWHLGTVVESVARAGGGYRLQLADGGTLEADLVLSAVGLRPDTRLAEAAGLEVHRGVVTDRLLRTSDPLIYALGDCAEVEGLNLPFVAPIMQGAKALARTLTGTPTPVRYPPMPVVIKTSLHPVVVAPPPRDARGSWQVTRLEGGVRALFEGADGRLLGFALTGTAAAEKQALTQRLPPLLA